MDESKDKKHNKYFLECVVRAALILFLSFILTIPLSTKQVYRLSFDSGVSTTTVGLSDQAGININGSEMQSVKSPSVFSKITGVEVLPLPVSVCLNNNNKIIFGNVVKKSDELPDGKEGAAMSVRVGVGADGVPIELYAPRNKQKCENINLNAGDHIVISLPDIRGVMPVGQAETFDDNGELRLRVPVYNDVKIDFTETNITVKTIIFTWIFIRNWFIYTLGIAILISLGESLIKFVLWKWS